MQWCGGFLGCIGSGLWVARFDVSGPSMGVSCTAWTMRGSSGCQLVRCSVLWTIQDDVGAGCLVCFEAGCFECSDRVLRQFNYHQPIPRPPPTRQHIHSAHRGRFDENWIVKQADFISVWEERHTRWAEDLSPLQANDFEFDIEYYSWYLENGKPFLVSVEVGNKWREDPRCSKHRQLTSEFGQSFEEPIDDPYDEPNFDRSRG
ncbi:hypothetical protein V6N12_020628 [Hibiscus sabdariffa]|uniref:Uncharacterized protein n=1 Tax=Hibiscus sabdariffa TaxID=183260 RepID=A0ABR2CYN4_9ROSI